MATHHALQHLIHIDRSAAAREILRVIKEAKGRMGDAAETIGCTHGTLLAWIKRADIRDEVDALIAKLKATGVYEITSGGAPGPRPFEVVDRKTGFPVGRGGFATMEAAAEKAKEDPKRWLAQRKPSAKERTARSRSRAV